MTRILIIGAGLSGRLVALNLLRHASSTAPVAVRVVDRCSERYMGPAYSDEADYLLLNVPAARMGAFSEDPEHFLKWVRERGHHAGSWDFLARGLYRDYIFSLLSDGKRSAGNRAMLEHVCGEATDIEVTHDRATVHVAGEEPFIADSAVLALGNFPPRHPRVENRSALQSGRYVQNPWTPDSS